MTRGRTTRAVLLASLLTAPLLAVPVAGAATATRRSAATTSSPATTPPRATTSPAAASLSACRVSPRVEGRSVTAFATVRPVPGSTRLALRLDLYERPLAGGRWTLRADVPGLGRWTSPSDPAIGSRSNDAFSYYQTVGRLVPGTAYRFRVGFRWLDGGGRLVRQTTRWTGPCRQVDLRPDLALSRPAAVRIIGPFAIRYSVVVRNRGASTARRVLVAATFAGDLGGGAPVSHTIGRLAPHQSIVLTFIAPDCPAGGRGATFTVDPAGTVDEVREGNNTVAVACPQVPAP